MIYLNKLLSLNYGRHKKEITNQLLEKTVPKSCKSIVLLSLIVLVFLAPIWYQIQSWFQQSHTSSHILTTAIVLLTILALYLHHDHNQSKYNINKLNKLKKFHIFTAFSAFIFSFSLYNFYAPPYDVGEEQSLIINMFLTMLIVQSFGRFIYSYLPLLLTWSFFVAIGFTFQYLMIVDLKLEYYTIGLIVPIAFSICFFYLAKIGVQRETDSLSLQLEKDYLIKRLNIEKQKSEDAINDKNRFLIAAFHDLRQPLQAIGLFIGSLKKIAADPQSQSIIAQIQESLSALTTHLNALFDLSKFDANIIKDNIQTINLHSFISKIAPEFEELSYDKGLAFIVDIPEKTQILSDPFLLEVVIRNLIGNAMKFTHRGSVKISAVQHRNIVEVKISDTGIGIDESDIDNIFREYYQIKQKSNEGLGLGLSIVQRITDQLNIPISVSSEPNAGTTFTLQLQSDNPQTR